MSQSLSKLYVHTIFHVKDERIFIRPEDDKENQKVHHKKLSFKEEYLQFLREYGVDFDEKYLWE